jgi:DNA mismatch endonuclease (patch repair protein)
MSRIHQPTKIEDVVHKWLNGQGIKFGAYPEIEGHPDTELFLDNGASHYLFIDGCFWHCCPTHYKRPKSRQDFWIPHIEESNAKREGLRRKLPYPWTRIWEHDVKNGRFKHIILAIVKKPLDDTVMAE